MSENKYIFLNGLIDLAQSRLGSKIIYRLMSFLLQQKESLIHGHLCLKKGFLISMANGWTVGKQEEKELKVTTI